MVNSTKSTTATPCKDENAQPTTDKDCHNVVKSSGTNIKHKGSCCEHHLRQFRRVNVACQTDSGAAGVFNDLGEANCSKTTVSPQKNDGSKPEGTLRLMIKNFHNMTDTVRGPGVPINNVPWKIMVMPRQHVMQKKGTQKCLGFFLQCCPDAYSDSWSCQASAELRLISQKSGVPNFTRKTNHTYTAKENDWGYSCFMTWADILDEAQGYIKDDKVILEVFVKADPPKNVLTYDGFCKKIQDYMRLADLQSSRGLIDKAIEVNQSALKFCKDKDSQCKDELEVQKQKLIEQKLKQSIERIEKGKTTIGEGDEDTTANLNALRQALTGNLAQAQQMSLTKPGEKDIKDKKDDKTLLTEGEKKKWPADGKKDGSPKKDISPPNGEDDVDKCKRDLGDGESAECSSGSECEDEDDELCDSCIQEQLETIISKETSEMGCQTEPLAMKAANAKANGANNNTSSGTNTTTAAACKQASQVQALQQKAAWDLAKKNQSLSSTGSLDENDASLAGGGKSTVPRWSAEKEAELLELITQESRQSLDSIRDTLERLVHLAQDGEVHPGLDFDLAALRETNHRVVKDGTIVHHQLPPVGLIDTGNMDVIELPGDVTPPDTDVVDLAVRAADTTTTTNAAVKEHNNNVKHTAVDGLNNTKSNDNNNNSSSNKEQLPTTPVSKTNSASVTNEEGLGNSVSTQQQQPPAPPSSPQYEYSEEEYTLIKHAKQIVESKAEELVSKYSQLIEQSEATRLAETVKKVEKRMKDIEKQTMTCRKELADECDRHYKEEQKLIKNNKQLKTNLDQANEKVDRLNTQIKERKAEIKKLEKRLKAETQTSADNYDLQQRIEQLEKELQAALKKNTDESKRHQRETQSLIDTKKQLQQDLASASSDIERLNNQLEEKGNALRKLENKHDHERKQTNATLRDAIERAKKAEVNLLEFKLEIGLKVLQRAADDCSHNIKHWESELKRYSSAQRYDESKLVQSMLTEWTDTKAKISAMLNSAKNDFVHQMDSVRSGKQLALLPTLEVPKPPPPPKPSQQLIAVLNREQQQHAAAQQQQQQAQQQPASSSSSGADAAHRHSYPGGGQQSTTPSNTPQVPQQQAPSVTPPSQPPQPQQATEATPSKPPLAPIGARPATAMSNGPLQSPMVADSASNTSMQQSPHVQMSAIQLPASSGGSSLQQQQQQQQHQQAQQSQAASMSGGGAPTVSSFHPSLSTNTNIVNTSHMPVPAASVSSGAAAVMAAMQQSHSQGRPQLQQQSSAGGGGMSNGFSLWDTQAIADQLFVGQRPGSAGQPPQHSHFAQQPQPSMQNGHGSASGVISGMSSLYEQWSAGGVAPQSNGMQPNQQQQQQLNAGGKGGATQQWAIGWGCYPPAPSSSTGMPPNHSAYVIDSRNSSPIGAHNEQTRHLDTVLEQLRAIYPNADNDTLRDTLNIYRSSLPQRSLKGLTVSEVVQGVVQFAAKQRMSMPSHSGSGSSGGGGSSNWSSSNEPGTDQCLCGNKMTPHDKGGITQLKCRHRFHSQCAHKYLSTKQHCPTCGAFNPCPDEYPELA